MGLAVDLGRKIQEILDEQAPGFYRMPLKETFAAVFQKNEALHLMYS